MNALDGIFILTITLFAFWGIKTGVLGMAIWLVAAYATIVIGAQVMGRITPFLPLPANYVAIVTSFGYIIVSVAVFTLARWISQSAHAVINFTPLKLVNDLGGAVLGAALGLLAVATMIVAAAIFTYVLPEGSLEFVGVQYVASYSQTYIGDAPRSWLDDQLTNSLIVEIFSYLRGIILPFAPSEIGLAADVLFTRIE